MSHVLEQKRDKNIAFFVIFFSFIIALVYIFKLYTSTLDDSFISFRYAVNLSQGDGLVFNLENTLKAEGITSPLYALVLSGFVFFGFDLEISAKVFGALCLFLVMYILFKFSLLLNENLKKNKSYIYLSSSLAILYYALDPYVISNSLTAMETILGVFLFTLLLYLNSKSILTNNFDKKNIFSLVFLSVLVPLARPELALSVVVLHILNFIYFKEKRSVFLQISLMFVIAGSTYFIWRHLYFGELLPLPFYIKQGAKGFFGFGQGKMFLYHYVIFIALASYVILHIKKEALVLQKIIYSLFFLLVIQMFYYLTIKHIMGFGFRYFQPIFPIIILLASLGSGIFLNKLKLKKNVIFILIITIISLLLGMQAFVSMNKAYLSKMTKGITQTILVAKAFATLEKKYTIAMNDCGAFPYFTMWKTIDLAGLNNRNIAMNKSKTTKLNEIKKNGVDFVFLVAKANAGNLYGYEKLEKSDVEKIGYEYLGDITLLKDYHWLVYGKKDGDYYNVLNEINKKGLINLKK